MVKQYQDSLKQDAILLKSTFHRNIMADTVDSSSIIFSESEFLLY